MGRFKSVEIKGLLFDDFGEMFISNFNDAVKSSNLSEEEYLERIAPEFEKILAKYEETISTLYLEHHKFKLDEFLKNYITNQQRIVNANRESFEAFILYINGCYIIYEKIVKKLNRKKIDHTLKLTFSLYGLVIRRVDQILSLLLAGYVDAAMIIWRSFYEYSIVLLVLALEENYELADRYYDHSIKNSRKKVLSYHSNYKALKFQPLSPSNDKILQSEVQKMEAKYGKAFLDNEYGWADILFTPPQKASFRLLEEKAEMKKFRPYYLLCNEHAHPGFNSFKHFIEDNKIILPRLIKQEYELRAFVDPMQFTLSVLHEVNQYILWEFSIEDEYDVNVLFMRKIFEKQQQTFDKQSATKARTKKHTQKGKSKK